MPAGRSASSGVMGARLGSARLCWGSLACAIVAIYRGSHYRLWLGEAVTSGFEMRVGDAEREAAAAEVREHFASGRLTQDELNQRLDQTFAAKTRGDLNAVFTDLPHATWRDGRRGAPSTAGDPYGGRTPLGPPGQQWNDWGTGDNGRSDDGANGPFGGGPGSRALQLVGVGFTSFMLFAAFLLFGIVGIFGIGSGRPFAVVLLFAAFAMLRRLLFLIFGRRRGAGRGPRRRRR